MKLIIALPEGMITLILTLYTLGIIYLIFKGYQLLKANKLSILEFLLLTLSVCLLPIIGLFVGWAIIKKFKTVK